MTVAAGDRRRLRLVNRTSRPWVLLALERREPSLPGRVLGSILAEPYGESGTLEVGAAPGRALYAALVDHVCYDSVLVSAVVTAPRELPDRGELVLEAVVEEGGLRLRLVG